MMGAFVAWIALTRFGINYWVSLIAAPLIVGALGVLIERLMLRRLYKLDHLYGLLLTFGLALIFEGVFRDQFGISGESYEVPELLSGGVNLGFMFLPIYANVEKLDYSLVRASRDLGATNVQTLWRIILPLTAPGIIGGSVIVFIPALGNFIVPSLLGGSKVQMTGNLIERSFLQSRDWPFGAALALLIMAFVVVLFSLQFSRQSKSEGQGTR